MAPQRYSDRGAPHLENAISARLPRAADRLADDRPPPILSTWNCAPPDGENRATPDRRSRSPRGLSRERPLVNDQRQIRSIPAIRGSAHDCKLVAYRVFGHMRERSKAKAPAAGHCCEKLRARASPERRRQDRYAQIQCFRQCCFERHIRFSPHSDRTPKVSPRVYSISPDFFTGPIAALNAAASAHATRGHRHRACARPHRLRAPCNRRARRWQANRCGSREAPATPLRGFETTGSALFRQ